MSSQSLQEQLQDSKRRYLINSDNLPEDILDSYLESEYDVIKLQKLVKSLKKDAAASRYESKQIQCDHAILQEQNHTLQQQHRDETLKMKREVSLLESSYRELSDNVMMRSKSAIDMVDTILDKVQTDKVKEKQVSTVLLLNKVKESLISIGNSPVFKDTQQVTTETSKADNSFVFDICNHLEVENAKLEHLLNESLEEIENYKYDASACKIIPHYRLALTRLRNQSLEILKKLSDEQQTNKVLKQQLACAYDEQRKTTDALYRLKLLNHRTETPQPVTRRYFPMNHEEIASSSYPFGIENVSAIDQKLVHLKEKLIKAAWMQTKAYLSQV